MPTITFLITRVRTDPNEYMARTNGSNTKIGPRIMLKVMAGDKFNLRVTSWYKTWGATPGTPAPLLDDLLAALVGGISGTGKFGATELQNSNILSPGATSFLNSQTVTTGRPKAYVNWVLFDEQMQYVNSSSGFD